MAELWQRLRTTKDREEASVGQVELFSKSLAPVHSTKQSLDENPVSKRCSNDCGIYSGKETSNIRLQTHKGWETEPST